MCNMHKEEIVVVELLLLLLLHFLLLDTKVFSFNFYTTTITTAQY